ncbi:DUF4342 domain-containing protein [Aminipila luticellarii]|uniref:DUF4342 domain-containing protein n=1 Tax=Aminipila luticellarii TaxID=2507160 RepID=A0A410PUY2_9FIRM|nr:DUF4342 domain-containing protein [Aminipila luticellarii]QAT42708.1 DUF4342 domain-containing protein [Aminipila luticellarii]
MEITLEKIELVKDRTGVSYKEAKEALEAADGSVVDAIIAIEESIDEKGRSKIGEGSSQIIEKIKETIKKGNVSKIIVKKDDEVMLNLPVNIGIVGTFLAPWAMIAGLIAAFGTKCVIELVKDDGAIIDISEMANDTIEDIVEKGAVIADEVKVKGSDVYNNVKNKTSDALNKVKKEPEDGCSYDEFECEEDCCCGEDSEKEECGCGCATEKSEEEK